MEKAWSSGADAVIFDLEDSVPEFEKSAARGHVQSALAKMPVDGPLCLVRINPLSTLHWRKDLDKSLGQSVRGIMVPKCQSSEEIHELEGVLEAKESEFDLVTGTIALFLLIETARGLIEVSKLAQVSERVTALVFGAEDFCLDMGISRTAEGSELTYARSLVTLSARAYQRLAIDTIYADFSDSEGLRRDSEVAKHTGFSGKMAIHPRQLQIINSVFAATDQELTEARRIVEAFQDAEAKGQGAIQLDGRMIDRPIVERARRLLRSSGVLA
jgi:citrate lyase subunit beta/citryl-CoA lyase